MILYKLCEGAPGKQVNDEIDWDLVGVSEWIDLFNITS